MPPILQTAAGGRDGHRCARPRRGIPSAAAPAARIRRIAAVVARLVARQRRALLPPAAAAAATGTAAAAAAVAVPAAATDVVAITVEVPRPPPAGTVTREAFEGEGVGDKDPRSFNFRCARSSGDDVVVATVDVVT